MSASFTIVSEHTRKKPFADRKEVMTARLLSEVDAHVDRQIAAAMRTFAINVWRAEREGRL